MTEKLDPPVRADVWASSLSDRLTMSIDWTPVKEPKFPATPLMVALQLEKLTMPKLASLVMLPPIDGLSAMHSAEDLTAPLTVPLVEKDCDVVTSVMVVVNWPAE